MDGYKQLVIDFGECVKGLPFPIYYWENPVIKASKPMHEPDPTWQNSWMCAPNSRNNIFEHENSIRWQPEHLRKTVLFGSGGVQCINFTILYPHLSQRAPHDDPETDSRILFRFRQVAHPHVTRVDEKFVTSLLGGLGLTYHLGSTESCWSVSREGR